MRLEHKMYAYILCCLNALMALSHSIVIQSFTVYLSNFEAISFSCSPGIFTRQNKDNIYYSIAYKILRAKQHKVRHGNTSFSRLLMKCPQNEAAMNKQIDNVTVMKREIKPGNKEEPWHKYTIPCTKMTYFVSCQSDLINALAIDI